MSPIMLHHGYAVHRAYEDQHEHGPMVERRAEQAGRDKPHGSGSGCKLDEGFHSVSLPHLDGSRQMAVLASKRLLNRPTAGTNAFGDRARLDSRFSAPLGNRETTAGVCQNGIGSAIVRLPHGGRPFAISLGVGPVIVDSLQRLTDWTIAHVGDELCEVVPSRADGNATSAIARESGIGWVQAPRPHVGPRMIEVMAPPAARVSVGRRPLGTAFGMIAATRKRRAGSKMFTIYNGVRPAIAETVPTIGISTISRFGFHDKSTEARPSQIQFSCHAEVYGEREHK